MTFCVPLKKVAPWAPMLIAGCVVALSISVAGTNLVLQQLNTTSDVFKWAQQQLVQHTGLILSAKNIGFSWQLDQGLVLIADGVTLSELAQGKTQGPVQSLHHLELGVALQPNWHQPLVVKNIEINSPQLVLTPNSRLFKLISKPSPPNAPSPVALHAVKLVISNGQVALQKGLVPQLKQPVTITLENLKIKGLEATMPVEAWVNGTLYTSHNKALVVGKGTHIAFKRLNAPLQMATLKQTEVFLQDINLNSLQSLVSDAGTNSKKPPVVVKTLTLNWKPKAKNGFNTAQIKLNNAQWGLAQLVGETTLTASLKNTWTQPTLGTLELSAPDLQLLYPKTNAIHLKLKANATQKLLTISQADMMTNGLIAQSHGTLSQPFRQNPSINGQLSKLSGNLQKLSSWIPLLEQVFASTTNSETEQLKALLQNVKASGFINGTASITGSIKNPLVQGAISANNVQIRLIKNPAPLLANTNINIRLQNKLVNLSTTGNLLSQKFIGNATTNIQTQRLSGNLVANNWQLAPMFKQTCQQFSPYLKDLQQLCATTQVVNGSLNLNTQLAGSLSKPKLLGGGNIQNLWAQLPGLVKPAKINTIQLNAKTLSAKLNTTGTYGAIPFAVKGNLLANGTYNIAITNPTLPASLFASQRDLLMGTLQSWYPQPYNTQGFWGFNFLATQAGVGGQVHLRNISLAAAESPYPIEHITGTINVLPSSWVNTPNLHFSVLNSPVSVTGKLHPLKTFTANISATPSSALLNYIGLQAGIPAHWHAPKNLQLLSQVQGNTLSLSTLHPSVKLNSQLVLTHTAQPNTPILNLVAQLKPNQFAIHKLSVADGDSGHLGAAGWFDLPTPYNTDLNFNLALSTHKTTFNLASWAQQLGLLSLLPSTSANTTATAFTKTEIPQPETNQTLTGTMLGDIYILNSNQGQRANGTMQIQNLSVPSLLLTKLELALKLAGIGGTAEISALEAPGLNMTGQLTSRDIFSWPVRIDGGALNGKLLHTGLLGDAAMALASQTPTQTKTVGPAEPVVPTTLVPAPIAITLPMELSQLPIHIDKLVVANLLAKNLDGRLSIYPSGFIEFKRASLEMAGGDVQGGLSLNPADDNFVSAQLDINNMSANAVTRALLGQSNLFYGNTRSLLRFTSHGSTPEALMNNVSGTGKVQIQDARIPTLEQIEGFLVVASLYKNGLSNLSLNSLFGISRRFRGKSYAMFSGDFWLTNGWAQSKNLALDGKNLDIGFKGGIRLADGQADMTINGRLEQKISGVFGWLGQLNLATLFNVLPGLGKLPNGKKGVLYYVPGIGWLPGLGRPGSTDGLRFKLNIKGPMGAPKSIQSLKWQ